MTDPKYDATDGPADLCVFCDEPMPADGAEAEVFLMSGYVETPFGEDTPARRVGLCTKHARMLRDRTSKTTELLNQ